MNEPLTLIMIGTSAVALACTTVTARFRLWSPSVLSMAVMLAAMVDMLDEGGDILPNAVWMFILLICAPLLVASKSRVMKCTHPVVASAMDVHRALTMITMVIVAAGAHGGSHTHSGGHSSGILLGLFPLGVAAYAVFTGAFLVHHVLFSRKGEKTSLHQPLEVTASGVSVLAMALMHMQ